MYKLYATLIDGFQDYLSSSDIYQEYWGFSENPSKTEEDFEAEQFQSLIDRINRVPFQSEAADRGTAFNEVVDCIIDKRTSDKMDIASNKTENTIKAVYHEQEFVFPLSETVSFAKQYEGALTQQYTEAILNTRYGDVLLYGYIDELMPFSVHDIKTTSKYKTGKFRKHWQKVVYPYCLKENGINIDTFSYDVVLWSYDKKSFSTFKEIYQFKPKDVAELVDIVERLICFLEANRGLISDLKVFGEEADSQDVKVA